MYQVSSAQTRESGRPPWKSSPAPEATEAAPTASMAIASRASHPIDDIALGWARDMYQVSSAQTRARPREARSRESAEGQPQG
jgi:hypothetical protein